MASVSQSCAETYHDLSEYQQQSFDDLLKSVGVQVGDRCLDIGCGTGNVTETLIAHVGEDGYVVGIDPDEKRVAVANERYKDIKNLHFYNTKIIDVPIAEGYNVVVCNHVLHWIKHEEKIQTFKNVFDALKDGGTFGIAVMCEVPLIGASAEKDSIYSFFYPEPKQVLIEMSENAGFVVSSIEEIKFTTVFASVDKYYDWINATFYGKIDWRKVCEDNKEAMKIDQLEDGRVKQVMPYTKFILKKPFK